MKSSANLSTFILSRSGRLHVVESSNAPFLTSSLSSEYEKQEKELTDDELTFLLDSFGLRIEGHFCTAPRGVLQSGVDISKLALLLAPALQTPESSDAELMFADLVIPGL